MLLLLLAAISHDAGRALAGGEGIGHPTTRGGAGRGQPLVYGLLGFDDSPNPPNPTGNQTYARPASNWARRKATASVASGRMLTEQAVDGLVDDAELWGVH